MKSIRLRTLVAALAFSSMSTIFAANPKTTVGQVTDAVTLNEAVDYEITGTDPFATAGSIDIANPDAAVVFVNIKPSVVISKYLSKITVNGVQLTNNTNCRVSIYRHGAIVLPHSDTKNPDGTNFYPLTTFEGDNCTGESTQYNGGSRKTSNTSFKMRSFKLKRGYMVTMANNTDGTGYSHCYIANSEDITIQLRKELADKVGFFRIFRWQWPAKKGVSDLNGEDARSKMGASWFYTWGSGENARVDAEFVPQRHHENGVANGGDQKWAWPSWSEINGRDETCTHVLGQNEPDNTSGGGEVNTYVSTIAKDVRGDGKGGTDCLMDHADKFLYSGMRIGTFANCNPNTSWVSDYVNRCRQQNIRVDFVATHYYIGGTSPQGCIERLKALYNATGLPVWVTEWNNGANWTGEGGFNTDAGWYGWGSDNAQNQKKNGEWLTDVLRRADKPENAWLERLAVYHAVETKRELGTWSGSTFTPNPAGEAYAAYKSDFAYNEANEYFMTWNHKAPSGLALEFKKSSKRAILSWSHENSKQTDSIYVERKISGVDADFVTIAKLDIPSTKAMTYNYDDLSDASGLVTYRIKDFDSDGKSRVSGEVSVTIGSSTGNNFFQYGTLSVMNDDEITTDFSTKFASIPAIFMGLPTNKNTSLTPTPLLSTISSTKFTYKMLPWKYQPNGTTNIANKEDISFMAIEKGNYKFGNIDMEVGATLTSKDTTEVTFSQPFPEGVTPIVITELANPILGKTNPISVKVFDVTNTGFKTTAIYEAAAKKTVTLGQNLSYMAVTPGYACLDSDNGIYISAGTGENPLYSTIFKNATFRTLTNVEGSEEQVADTLLFENPNVFGALQTYNIPAATALKNVSFSSVKVDDKTYANAVRVKRVVDDTAGAKNTLASADTFGWVVISSASKTTPVGIEEVVTVKSEDPIDVEVINRCIYVNNADKFDVYTISGAKVASNATQEPGVYIVRSGNRVAKVMVK